MFSLSKLFTPTSRPTESNAPVFFTNTLSGKKDLFVPQKTNVVTMYSCGPTVYSQAQIGNLRAYVFSDTVARILMAAGYPVRRAINITDVGHLVSDADEGEDKMEKGARLEGVSAQDIATRYTKLFLDDIRLLNIDTEHILFPRATEYIKEQIAMIQTLEEKGYTYKTSDGIYFDTVRFAGYGKLGGLSGAKLKEEAVAGPGRRIKENKEKKSPADFALWKYSERGVQRQQEWQSPWGIGFPGWHIECSAMVKALLGETIDIHTGGIDHIPVHHNNEIAQSECALGHPFVRYWIHGAFLTIEGEKISKSLGNTVYLSDVVKHGIHPLALRYFFLQASYRSPLTFSWTSLEASAQSLRRLWRLCKEVGEESKRIAKPSDESRLIVAMLRDDLSTPQAIAQLWDTLKDEDLSPSAKWGAILAADEVLGLSLTAPHSLAGSEPVHDLPEDIQDLIQQRDAARAVRDFKAADALRIHIENSGYAVDDSPEGTTVRART